MRNTIDWQVEGPSSTLRRTPLQRRDLRPDDIAVRVDYYAVCHTDVHAVSARNGEGDRPLVPGQDSGGPALIPRHGRNPPKRDVTTAESGTLLHLRRVPRQAHRSCTEPLACTFATPPTSRRHQ